MANRAYLIASDTNAPAGPTEEDINYDPDTEILAASSYDVPAFWCSIFTEHDIHHHELQGFRIPAPTVETQVARERFAQRRAVLESTFSNFTHVVNEWANLLNGVSEQYIKIDTTEIWDMSSEEFEEQFPAAIRWFDSQAASDFDQLVRIAGFEYDSSASRIISDAPDIAGNHLRGYGWVRAVPWDDA